MAIEAKDELDLKIAKAEARVNDLRERLQKDTAGGVGVSHQHVDAINQVETDPDAGKPHSNPESKEIAKTKMFANLSVEGLTTELSAAELELRRLKNLKGDEGVHPAAEVPMTTRAVLEENGLSEEEAAAATGGVNTDLSNAQIAAARKVDAEASRSDPMATTQEGQDATQRATTAPSGKPDAKRSEAASAAQQGTHTGDAQTVTEAQKSGNTQTQAEAKAEAKNK